MKKAVQKKLDVNDLVSEISTLCRKYGLKDCVFSGENEEGKMVGLFCIEREGIGFTQKNMIGSAFNASRLYQASREKIMHSLDGK